MAASPDSLLSAALQSITKTKISQLTRVQQAHDAWLRETMAAIETFDDNSQADRLDAVEMGLNSSHPSFSKGQLSKAYLSSWAKQSRFDASLSPSVLRARVNLFKRMEAQQKERFRFARLYCDLLTDWISQSQVQALPDPITVKAADPLETDDFEILQKDRLQRLREQFADVVFSKPTGNGSHEDILSYVRTLFPSKEAKLQWDCARGGLYDFGHRHFATGSPFTLTKLKALMQGVLGDILLSDDKKAVLRGFMKDEDVLTEIADVLNMRWADIENWSWEAGPEGLSVEPRQQLNGKYRVMADEDILQAIFLHHIGIIWSVELRQRLSACFNDTDVWTELNPKSQDAIDRLRFYCPGRRAKTVTSQSARRNRYFGLFHLMQLPRTDNSKLADYDDDGSDNDNDDGSDWEDGDDERETQNMSATGTRQKLLREMATDVLVAKKLHGQVAVIQSDLQWFGTALPHSTLVALLEFAAVPDKWIEFLLKFLRAPLNMGDGKGVRERERGIPMAHSLSLFFGELVLAFMDLAVNKEADGVLLYRLHDDLFLWGEPEKVAKAWQTMQRFASLMGLQFNAKKTGSVYFAASDQRDPDIEAILPDGNVSIGFLKLNKDAEWEIDRPAVDEHAHQLLKQLKQCDSVFSWIQTWNSCIGRFFVKSFGEPANVFGAAHVQAILETHRHIQSILFADDDGLQGQNYMDHLKIMISKRHGIPKDDIPNGFLALPEHLGGLGVTNPFGPFLHLDHASCEGPSNLMDDYLSNDEARYNKLRDNFLAEKPVVRRQRLDRVFPMDEDDENNADDRPDPNEFMTFEDWVSYREAFYGELGRVKRTLRTKNSPVLDLDEEMRNSIAKGMDEDSGAYPDSWSPDLKWTVITHHDELMERFGRLQIAERNFLPLTVIKMLQEQRVSWQMAL